MPELYSAMAIFRLTIPQGQRERRDAEQRYYEEMAHASRPSRLLQRLWRRLRSGERGEHQK